MQNLSHKMSSFIKFTLKIILLLAFYTSWSQTEDLNVELGPSKITLNEEFKVTFHLPFSKLKSLSNFPEIQDFNKSSTVFTKENNEYKITQTYLPRKEGTFVLEDFNFIVNGKTFLVNGTTIEVIKKKTNKKPEEKPLDLSKFISPKVDAFYKVETSKSEVFVGEPLEVKVSYNINKENTTEINFIDLKEQVTKIRNKLKPQNVWIEELSDIQSLSADTINIKNKTFRKYIIFHAVYYPIDTTSVHLPSTTFKMLKYKISKTTNLIERIPDYLTYTSEPISVKIKALPPHPNQENALIGSFRLQEKVSPSSKIYTGDGITYQITVKGEGNTSLVPNPFIINNSNFEIFESRISNPKNDQSNKINDHKEKTFEYFLLAKKPGTYKMKEIFYWLYFNPTKEKYDTLFPKSSVKVIGEEINPNEAPVKETDEFYNLIHKSNNKVKSFEKDEKIKIIANLLLIIMLISSIVLILKKQ